MTQTVIGISGLIGSGKDTAAQVLVDELGFERMSFAMVLKDVTAVLFDWDRDMLEGTTPESRAEREIADPWWTEKMGREWSPRIALQVLGTDVMRNNLHENIWVNTVENRLRKAGDVVFTDVRFPNEIEFINKVGKHWVVDRGKYPAWYDQAVIYNRSDSEQREKLELAGRGPEDWGAHASEYSWVGCFPDAYIANTKTIEDLHFHVRNLV